MLYIREHKGENGRTKNGKMYGETELSLVLPKFCWSRCSPFGALNPMA